MSGILALTAILGYILSLGLAVLLAAGKAGSGRFPARTFLILHFILLLMSGLMFAFTDNDLYRSLFLFAVITGILLSGAYLREKTSRLLKGYFLLYPLTVLLFIWSPSTLLLTITASFPRHTKNTRYFLQGNHYLERQQAFIGETETEQYKIVRDFGFFHRTVVRDIQLPAGFDSIRLLEMQGDTFRIRSYYPVFLHDDSTLRTDSTDHTFVAREGRPRITRKTNSSI